jgi:hypothetical protein
VIRWEDQEMPITQYVYGFVLPTASPSLSLSLSLSLSRPLLAPHPTSFPPNHKLYLLTRT